MATKYTWKNKNYNNYPIVRAGSSWGTWNNGILSNWKDNYCDTIKTNKYTNKKKYTFKTALSSADIEITLKYKARRQSPNYSAEEMIESDSNTWEAIDLELRASKVDLPMGYFADVYPQTGSITKKTGKDWTNPVFIIPFKISIGPLIGSATKYNRHSVTIDPRGRKITWR